MSFSPRPDYSKSYIDRAGVVASSAEPGSPEYEAAIHVIDEWRKAHGYPLHTFFITLRRKANTISRGTLIARRLKRMPTILDKISSRESSMKLSRMQDIGGVRAILPEVKHVYALRDMYIKNRRFPHELKLEHDYVANPKASGYRGIHLVYEFNNTQGRTENARCYDGLKVEMQLRTQLQHEWAATVEAVGMILGKELKSSKGPKKWLSFFQGMSSVIATIEEQPVLEKHRGMHGAELLEHTKALAEELDVVNKLAGWLAGVRSIDEGTGYYYHILTIDIKEKMVRIIRFEKSEFDEANAKLVELEKLALEKKTPEPVLVAAGDIKKLRKAYPNYFLDMREFLKIVETVRKSTQTN